MSGKELRDLCTSSDVVRIKGKVVPVHFLTKHHSMKTYWGVEV